MSPAKARAGASKRNAKAAVVPLVVAALKVLSDPETREAIAERGKVVVDWASERRVVRWLDSVDRTLLVASGLPLRKRKKTHRAIDRQLDDVEELLLELTLPGTSPVGDA